MAAEDQSRSPSDARRRIASGMKRRVVGNASRAGRAVVTGRPGTRGSTTGDSIRTGSSLDAMSGSGDPRVLLVLNLVLSGVFATVVVWGLDFIQVVTFTWTNVAILTLALVLLTHLVVMR